MIRRLGLAAGAVAVLLLSSSSRATVHQFIALMSGPNESPPNASPGTGIATVDLDDVAHTMTISADFSGLTGTTTIAHIHAPTAVPFVSTASVATAQPSFPGWPAGVTAGSYDNVFDMTNAASYNPSYITGNGGTPATAEAALLSHIQQGRAYFNIHSSTFPGGEIRGFLVPIPEPAGAAVVGGAMGLYTLASRRRRGA